MSNRALRSLDVRELERFWLFAGMCRLLPGAMDAVDELEFAVEAMACDDRRRLFDVCIKELGSESEICDCNGFCCTCGIIDSEGAGVSVAEAVFIRGDTDEGLEFNAESEAAD